MVFWFVDGESIVPRYVSEGCAGKLFQNVYKCTHHHFSGWLGLCAQRNMFAGYVSTSRMVCIGVSKMGLVVYQTVRPQIIKNTFFKNPTSIARGSIHQHFQKIFKPYSGFVRETGKTRYTLNAIRLASSKFIFVCIWQSRMYVEFHIHVYFELKSMLQYLVIL